MPFINDVYYPDSDEFDYYDGDATYESCIHCGCKHSVYKIDASFDAYGPGGGLRTYTDWEWRCRHCDDGEPECEDCMAEDDSE